MVSGFLLVDKDPGWTSHDVVAKVRRLVDGAKVGHAGTLDPMATGLLVLGMGRATRLMRFIQDLPKTYHAEARFGIATDTLDADGRELERRPMPVTEGEVAEALQELVGAIEQVPPMVSAVKVGGRRLYELAREGQEVERRPRRVEVHGIDLTGFVAGDHPLVSVRVRCGKGTYVRTLLDDAARRLDGRAHLTSLRRVAIGSLRVEDASTVAQLETLAGAEAGVAAAMLSPAAGLADLDAVVVDAETAARARHGARLESVGNAVAPLRLLDPHGSLVGVYRSQHGRLVPEVVVAP